MMIFIGIVLFAFLVIAHEYGHFVTARRNGVEVEEFGIGFPPRLFGRKHGETLYSFNLIPLGGFVKLKGESNSDKGKSSFGSASLWVKTKILLAGVGMNVITTAVIIFFLAVFSLPQLIPNQYRVPANEIIKDRSVVVAQVAEGSAAAQAGLASGDKLLTFANTPIDSSDALRSFTAENSGESIEISYQRGDAVESKTVQLGTGGDDGYLGVLPLDTTTTRYTWAAPLVAVGITFQMIGIIFGTLGQIFVDIFSGAGQEAAAQITGPVGVVFLLQNLGDFGLEYLLFLLASISASLAVFNVLPIPALDGGRLAVIAGAKVLKKELSESVETAIHGFGFIALMALFILITYVDIQRFF